MELWPGSATVVAVRRHGAHESKPTEETRNYASSLRTGSKALFKANRQRKSIANSWHWVQDVPVMEDTHRYRENNGQQIVATLLSLEIIAIRLDGI